MFDWIGAREYGLLWIIRQYWLLRSHLCEEQAEKYDNIVGKVLPELGSNRSIAQMQDLKKLLVNSRHGNDEFWKQICHVYFVVCKRPFHGHWDRPELIPILSWFLFCDWLGRQIQRETMGSEGGVSSLVDKGRNFERGWWNFSGSWNFSEQFQMSPANIGGGNFAPYEKYPIPKWQLACKMRRAKLSQISAGTCSNLAVFLNVVVC